MALAPLGVLDLSIVTDRLIKILEDCINNSSLWATLNPHHPKPSFTINVSGSMPEIARKDGTGCTLSVCLIHVAPNKFQRNFVAIPPPPPPAPPAPPQRALAIPSQPLSLDLYYLVTAFDADHSYIHEQQVMSIALKCFHENPIVTTTVPFPPPQPSVKEEFALTMEIETSDDAARLWQAITVPYRFSVFYKVSVAFMSPPAPPATAKQAVRFGLAVDPAVFPYAPTGQVIGTSSTATYTSPHSTTANPEIVSFDYSPATVIPGQRFFLYGSGLNQGVDFTGVPPNPGTSYRVYLLLPPDYTTEQEVTSWKTPDVDPNNPIQASSRIVLDPPSSVGVLPANSPLPGIYQIRAGSDPPADATKNRSNATPFSVAPRVDVSIAPTNPPILLPVAGRYKVNGAAFISGSTQVLLEAVPLTEAPPAPGTFQINGPGTVITFQAPPGLASGLYGVRIRVNQVEAPPSWWIKV